MYKITQQHVFLLNELIIYPRELDSIVSNTLQMKK